MMERPEQRCVRRLMRGGALVVASVILALASLYANRLPAGILRQSVSVMLLAAACGSWCSGAYLWGRAPLVDVASMTTVRLLSGLILMGTSIVSLTLQVMAVLFVLAGGEIPD